MSTQLSPDVEGLTATATPTTTERVPVWRALVPTPAPDVTAEAFREAMSAFPAAVSVVTALDAEGVPRGLTCSALASVTVEPPTLLVCVNRRNRSLDAIRGSGGFVVNLLRETASRTSDLFASGAEDKFSPVDWLPGPASGLPWLHTDALVALDCRLVAEVEVGSHAVLFGHVRDCRTGQGPPQTDGALLYWRRAYGRWSPRAADPTGAGNDPQPPSELPGRRDRDGRRRGGAIAHPTHVGDAMNTEQLRTEILAYIRNTFLDGDAKSELDENTPLLEWRILTSMNTAVLLAHIASEYQVEIPPDRINGTHFQDVSSIVALIEDVATVRNA